MLKENIPLPNKIYFEKEDKHKSVVVIEPLYPGYGTTVGNALRRVLLSSLPGAAVTAVKIKGVDHEFSTINEVTEDVVDIILNLKQLRLRLNADEPVKLVLQTKGKKEVHASDIKKDSRAEIINEDLLIATLDNKNADLYMEITVQNGRGYVPVEMREGAQKMEIGTIAVDAIYTPMRNVNFEVSNVRVGQITNYDKLTITMETDGTISGREALDIASQILVEHFSLLKTEQMDTGSSAPIDSPAFAVSAEEAVAPEVEVSTGVSLESLGLSNRAFNALTKNGIATVEQVQKLSREDLENLGGLGAKSIDEILKVIGK